MDARTRCPPVYLAGPMVFEREPGEIFAWMKCLCEKHGLKGISPLDNQIGLEGVLPGAELMHRIVEADIDLMNRAAGGVFCLDGFRSGPEMDPGTAFEVGYMRALKKPIVGWTQDKRLYEERVAQYFDVTYGKWLIASNEVGGVGARSGALRDPTGMLVHSQGYYQNAMVQGSIELAGGAVFANVDRRLAFEQAVERLAQLLLD